MAQEKYTNNSQNETYNQEDMTQLELVKSNQTSPEMLAKIATETINKAVLKELAGNPRTSAETLKNLHSSGVEIIERNIAANINTPDDLLDELSKSDDIIIRALVAQNEAVSIEMLDQLADDESEIVRLALSQNPNITESMLKHLYQQSRGSQNEFTFDFRLTDNPKTSPETLQKIANSTTDKLLLEQIKKHPKTSPETVRLCERKIL